MQNAVKRAEKKLPAEVVATSTRKSYKTGVRISDETLKGLNMHSQVDEGPEQIQRWNYLFRPQTRAS